MKKRMSLAGVIALAMFAIAGCGGGGGSIVAPPVPNPNVTRTVKYIITAVNPVKGNQPVKNAEVIITNASGTVNINGTTDEDGLVTLSAVPEGTYTTSILSNFGAATPNFIGAFDNLTVAGGNATKTIDVTPLYMVEVHVAESATPQAVDNAIVELSGRGDNAITLTTSNSNPSAIGPGIVLFEEIPMGNSHVASVTNLGSTNPRIGLDTLTQTFDVYEDLTGAKAITISGLVPPCFADDDAVLGAFIAGLQPDGGSVYPVCVGTPGTASAIPQWRECIPGDEDEHPDFCP